MGPRPNRSRPGRLIAGTNQPNDRSWRDLEEGALNGLLIVFALAGGIATVTAGLGLRATLQAAPSPAPTTASTRPAPDFVCARCADPLGAGPIEQCAHCHTGYHSACLRDAPGCAVAVCPSARSMLRFG